MPIRKAGEGLQQCCEFGLLFVDLDRSIAMRSDYETLPRPARRAANRRQNGGLRSLRSDTSSVTRSSLAARSAPVPYPHVHRRVARHRRRPKAIVWSFGAATTAGVMAGRVMTGVYTCQQRIIWRSTRRSRVPKNEKHYEYINMWHLFCVCMGVFRHDKQPRISTCVYGLVRTPLSPPWWRSIFYRKRP